MPWSNATNTALLTQLFTAGSFGALTLTGDIYVALSTTTPGEDGTNVTEPAGGDGYARQQLTPDAVVPATPGAETRVSSAAMTFGPATASWGTITHVALYDAATGGNFIGFAALASSQAVASGNSFEISAGDLQLGNN